MPLTIDQLSTATTLSGADKIAVYSANNADARKASLNSLLAWIESNFASPEFSTQYVAPPASGFVYQVQSASTSIWLIMQPAGTLATGSIVLPLPANSFDGQEIMVFSSHEVTAFTVFGNGSLVYGSPTYMPANGSFVLRFNALQNAWYCMQPATTAVSYSATSWTPVYNGAGLTGTVTLTGRVTQIGRQVTLDLLIVCGNAPGDQLVWSPGDYISCALPIFPIPYSNVYGAAFTWGTITNLGVAQVALPVSLRSDVFGPKIDIATGWAAPVTIPTLQNMQATFVYTI